MKMALSLGTIFATVAKKLKTSRKANSTKFPVNNKGNDTKKTCHQSHNSQNLFDTRYKKQLTHYPSEKPIGQNFQLKNKTKFSKRICYQGGLF